jgi:signal transduction histidine kinase
MLGVVLPLPVQLMSEFQLQLWRKGYEEEEEVLISIEDTGSGIDPEIFPRLFTKFSSKPFSGTGLGLYVSKSISRR